MGNDTASAAEADDGETVDASKITQVRTPSFYVTGINVVWTGNDFNAVLTAPRPVAVEGRAQLALASQAVATLSMSPQTAKDVAVLMTEMVRQFEAEWGEVDTPYLRRVQAEKK